MVAYFAAAPVSAGKACEGSRAVFLRGYGGNVEGAFGYLVGIEGAGALDEYQAACSGQLGLEWLKGIDTQGTLVKASVSCVGLFAVGKRGVAVLAVSQALWYA